MMRPRDMLSSMANSSAMWMGLPTKGKARPKMAMRMRLVRWIKALAIKLGAGISP